MASIEGPADGDSFPAVNATRELNLGVPEEFPVDPISADVENAKQLKEEAEARAKATARAKAKARAKAAKEAEKSECCLGGALASTLTVAAVVAAAIGVAFIVSRKLKHI